MEFIKFYIFGQIIIFFVHLPTGNVHVLHYIQLYSNNFFLKIIIENQVLLQYIMAVQNHGDDKITLRTVLHALIVWWLLYVFIEVF